MKKAIGFASMMENWLITAAALFALIGVQYAVAAQSARHDCPHKSPRLRESSLELKQPSKDRHLGAAGPGRVRREPVRVEIDSAGKFRVSRAGHRPEVVDEKGLQAFVQGLPEPGLTEVVFAVPWEPFQVARGMLRNYAVHYEMDKPAVQAEKEVDSK